MWFEDDYIYLGRNIITDESEIEFAENEVEEMELDKTICHESYATCETEEMQDLLRAIYEYEEQWKAMKKTIDERNKKSSKANRDNYLMGLIGGGLARDPISAAYGVAAKSIFDGLTSDYVPNENTIFEIETDFKVIDYRMQQLKVNEIIAPFRNPQAK